MDLDLVDVSETLLLVHTGSLHVLCIVLIDDKFVKDDLSCLGWVSFHEAMESSWEEALPTTQMASETSICLSHIQEPWASLTDTAVGAQSSRFIESESFEVDLFLLADLLKFSSL